jgi:hypothetical protein
MYKVHSLLFTIQNSPFKIIVQPCKVCIKSIFYCLLSRIVHSKLLCNLIESMHNPSIVAYCPTCSPWIHSLVLIPSHQGHC